SASASVAWTGAVSLLVLGSLVGVMCPCGVSSSAGAFGSSGVAVSGSSTDGCSGCVCSAGGCSTNGSSVGGSSDAGGFSGAGGSSSLSGCCHVNSSSLFVWLVVWLSTTLVCIRRCESVYGVISNLVMENYGLCVQILMNTVATCDD